MVRIKKKHATALFCIKSRALATLVAALLPLMATQAQDVDMTLLYKQAVDQKLHLDSLKRALEDKRKSQAKELKQTAATYKALQADSAKLQKEVDKLNGQGGLAEMRKLKEEEAQYRSDIAQAQAQIEQMRNTLAAMETKLDELRQTQHHLDHLEDGVMARLVSTSAAYLSLPFSKQETARLKELKEQCAKYEGNQRADSLAQATLRAIASKDTYDKARHALESPYQPNDVATQASTLRGIKTMNAEQQQEKEATLRQLDAYKQGVATLRLFVQNFADEREKGMGMVTASDCDDAVNSILREDNMQQRIKVCVEAVPYLNRQYKAYLKAIKANFKKPTDIEKEILGATTDN